MDEFIYHVVQNHVPVSCNRVATSEILASMMKTSSMQFDLFVSIFRCKAGHWSHCFLQLFSSAIDIDRVVKAWFPQFSKRLVCNNIVYTLIYHISFTWCCSLFPFGQLGWYDAGSNGANGLCARLGMVQACIDPVFVHAPVLGCQATTWARVGCPVPKLVFSC